MKANSHIRSLAGVAIRSRSNTADQNMHTIKGKVDKIIVLWSRDKLGNVGRSRPGKENAIKIHSFLP